MKSLFCLARRNQIAQQKCNKEKHSSSFTASLQWSKLTTHLRASFWSEKIWRDREYIYTGCPRRNVPDTGRVFLMLMYADITQNNCVRSWTFTVIMARGNCDLLAGPRTVPVSWQSYPFPSLSVVSYDGNWVIIHRTATRTSFRVIASAGCGWVLNGW